MYNDSKGTLPTSTVGLSAHSIKGTKTAWEWYAKNYNTGLPETFGDDREYLDRLKNDNYFNILTTAVLLLFISGSGKFSKEDGSKLWLDPNDISNWTERDWKDVIFNYNRANGYNDKVMEYVDDIKILIG